MYSCLFAYVWNEKDKDRQRKRERERQTERKREREGDSNNYQSVSVEGTFQYVGTMILVVIEARTVLESLWYFPGVLWGLTVGLELGAGSQFSVPWTSK